MTYVPRPIMVTRPVVNGDTGGIGALTSLCAAMALDDQITNSTTSPQLPSIPVSQATTNIGSTTAQAHWIASVVDSGHSAPTGYQVDVGIDSGFTSGVATEIAGNVTSFTVTGLLPTTQYWLRIRAFNAVGVSGNSSTQGPFTTLVAPATQTVNPSAVSSGTNVINPLMGEYTWYGQSSPSGLTSNDAYERFQWIDLEGGQGSYNWGSIDAGISAATARGGRYGFGIMMVNEGAVQRAYPSYISGGWTWTDPGTGGALDIPDWNNASYLNAFDNLMAAIANHVGPNGLALKNDLHLGWLDLSGFGAWGEWHTYGSQGNWGPGPNGQAEYFTQSTLQRLVATNINNFPNCMISAFTDNATELNYVLGLGSQYGVTIKCFGTGGLGGDAGTAATEPCASQWKTAPMWGEWCNGQNSGAASTLLNQVTSMHMSMIGTGNNPSPDPRSSGTYAQAIKLMGYRLRLSQVVCPSVVTSGGSCQITASWVNDNVAPPWLLFATKWMLKRNGVTYMLGTSSADLRLARPDTASAGSPMVVVDSFSVPTSLASGAYTLCCRVDDPGIAQGLPAIALGQTSTRDADGAYQIATISI